MKNIDSSLRVTKLSLFACTLLSSAVTAAPSDTEDSETQWTVPVSIGVVSDYIFRGQSQTWGDPAVQFSVEAQHQSGFYAGFFASNVSSNWLPGAQAETDIYGGYRGKVSEDVGYDLGVIYYGYPGGNWKYPWLLFCRAECCLRSRRGLESQWTSRASDYKELSRIRNNLLQGRGDEELR